MIPPTIHNALAIAVTGLVGLAIGCSPESPQECPAPHATFRLSITTQDGSPVPDSTIIVVKYGSGKEVCVVAHPTDAPEVVFCKAEKADAGSVQPDDAGSLGLQSITCDLWTDGAATIIITADGYPDLTRDLSARADHCGLVLTEATIQMQRGD